MIDKIPNIKADIALPLLFFLINGIIPKIIANTPRKKAALLIIGNKRKTYTYYT